MEEVLVKTGKPAVLLEQNNKRVAVGDASSK